MSRPATASVINLGCVKNLVDSEIMAAQLHALGYALTDTPEEADIIVVNTCGFLESAVQEAIDSLLDLSRLKEIGRCAHLVAVGCMVQRYGKKLPELLPEVDLFIGTSYYESLAKIIAEYLEGSSKRLWLSRPRNLMDRHTERIQSTPRHTAYVKIADGCSNTCSFCMIPHLRGPYRSRSREDVMYEAKRLVESGVKEINLVAQDTTAFGTDRGEKHGFVRLLEDLDLMPDLQWIRILYAYPERVSSTLLQTMAQADKIVPYLDVPLQHSVPRILDAMCRDRAESQPRKFIEMVRGQIPEIALRTSIMVGFPGETDRDFQELLEFVQWAQFNHLGVFVFSPEAGCKAGRLPGRVPPDLAEARKQELMSVQRSISRAHLKPWVGKTASVLVDGFHPETNLLLQGRLPTQAPDVDGVVIITAGTASAGEVARVKITAHHDYDLEGAIAA